MVCSAVTKKDLSDFNAIFQAYDTHRTNSLSSGDLFRLIKEPKSSYALSILELVGISTRQVNHITAHLGCLVQMWKMRIGWNLESSFRSSSPTAFSKPQKSLNVCIYCSLPQQPAVDWYWQSYSSSTIERSRVSLRG